MNNVHFPTPHSARSAISWLEVYAWSDQPYDAELEAEHQLVIGRLRAVSDAIPLTDDQIRRIEEVEERWDLKRPAGIEKPGAALVSDRHDRLQEVILANEAHAVTRSGRSR